MNLILIRQLKLLAFTVDILMQILVIFKKIYLLLLLQNIARNPADSIELSDVNLMFKEAPWLESFSGRSLPQ